MVTARSSGHFLLLLRHQRCQKMERLSTYPTVQNLGASSSDRDIQQRISDARERQIERQGKINSQLSSQELRTICRLNTEQQALMDSAINRFALSTRGFYRVLRVARSIADLENRHEVKTADYQEALSYRITSDTKETS